MSAGSYIWAAQVSTVGCKSVNLCYLYTAGFVRSGETSLQWRLWTVLCKLKLINAVFTVKRFKLTTIWRCICHDHRCVHVFTQAMKVVSKKRLMKQCGFFRELMNDVQMPKWVFIVPVASVVIRFCVCVPFQAVRLFKGHSRICSLKPHCLWRRCTRRSPSWRSWTITMLWN